MESTLPSRQPAGPPILTMRGVDLRIGRRTVLDHVDLDVHKGELLALVGANGAGKSSVLRCMAGVWEPTAGTITVNGLDRFADDLAIRRFTAYLPPDPSLRALSLRENLRVIADAYDLGEQQYRERMDSLLRMFDLKHLQDSRVNTLSKGEKKKACLAMVLITGASCYLLDEPFTGGIDPRGYAALRRVLDRLAANRDVTVVFATQVLDMAVALADRIAVVNGGRILAIGTVDELRKTAGAAAGVPFDEVFARLGSRDTDVPAEHFLAALEGQA